LKKGKKNVHAQQEEESPGRSTVTTAGLTSAEQLTDTTGAITFDINNTASVVPQYFLSPVEQPEKARLTFSKKARFTEILRASMRRNSGILDELAKL